MFSVVCFLTSVYHEREIMATAKKQFRCGQCGKKVNTIDAARVAAKRCTACMPDLALLPAKVKKSATARPVAAPAKRRRAAKPAVPIVKAVAAPVVASKPVAPAKGKKSTIPTAPVPPVAEAKSATPKPAVSVKGRRGAAKPAAVPPVTEVKPVVVPSAEIVALDQQIAEVREAMNRLASDLSAKQIVFAGLRDQRRALGPLPRSRRDPDAPRRVTLLDAAAIVLADASEPLQAKAIWQAIVERDLWSTPNGGKTSYATLAATMLREISEKGAGARFVKAGRGGA